MENGPNTTIGYLLQHLSGVLSKQSDQVLSERLGVGYSQFRILLVLADNPRAKQKVIASKLGQTEASVSRQVGLMHDQNLLQTTVNPANRREHLTHPTAKGGRLLEEALRILNSYHEPMFSRLNDRQRETLIEALQIMHDSTCQQGKLGACDHS